MKQVNYILVNETAHKKSVCDVHHRFVPNIGQCIVVEAGSAQGSKSRTALIQKLIILRKHYPEAKILGTSELDGKSIKVSKAMNGLRKELSNLP